MLRVCSLSQPGQNAVERLAFVLGSATSRSVTGAIQPGCRDSGLVPEKPSCKGGAGPWVILDASLNDVSH